MSRCSDNRSLAKAAAQFVASWGYTTQMRVHTLDSGFLRPGQLIYGAGITDGTTIIAATETAKINASTFGNDVVDVLSVFTGGVAVGDEVSGTGIPAGARVVSLASGGSLSPYTGRVDISGAGRFILSHPVTSAQTGITLRAINTGVGTYTISHVQVDKGEFVGLKSAGMTCPPPPSDILITEKPHALPMRNYNLCDLTCQFSNFITEPSIKRAVPHEKIHDHTRASQQVCPLGNFCQNGIRNKCPVGTFGNTTGLSRCERKPSSLYPPFSIPFNFFLLYIA